MAEWLVLADDLSGANDTGAAFARRGLETVAARGPGPLPSAAVWVISTASRALPPREAESLVREALAALGVYTPPRLYKKIDSALRGNPAEELRAMLLASGAKRCLIAPAFPSQGRATRAGRVTWRGLPLSETEFRGQVRSDDLFELFRPAAEIAPLHALGLETVRAGAEACAAALDREAGLWIADAESDADLDALVRAAEAAFIPALCGSAGLAGALARGIPERESICPLPERSSRPAVLAAGSRSAVAALQVEEALKAGARRLALPEAYLQDGDLARLAEGIMQTRDARGVLAWVLALEGLPEQPGRADLLARRLGAAAADLARRASPAGLVLTGGDTAAAAFDALGARLVRLLGEIEPGVAWGRLLEGELPGLAVVTKAGSFGAPDTLARALRFLNS